MASTSATGQTTNATLVAINPIGGFSVSGDVRTADLLTDAGFKTYDGNGCATSAMTGVEADGSPAYNVGVDSSGSLCETPNAKYQAISATLATASPCPGSGQQRSA